MLGSNEMIANAVAGTPLPSLYGCERPALADLLAPLGAPPFAAEQVYRFNHRVTTDWHRFEQTLRQIGGKRLTFRVLTGKDDAGFMGLN